MLFSLPLFGPKCIAGTLKLYVELRYLPRKRYKMQLKMDKRSIPAWNVWLCSSHMLVPIIYQGQWITRGSLNKDLWRTKKRGNRSVYSDRKVLARELLEQSIFHTSVHPRHTQARTHAYRRTRKVHTCNVLATGWISGALPLRVMNTSAELFPRRNFLGRWARSRWPLPRFQ